MVKPYQVSKTLLCVRCVVQTEEVVHANAEQTGSGYGMEIACLIKAEGESQIALAETKTKNSRLGKASAKM